nr:hypothetical protein [Tanacetum cinerariifolium]
MALTFADTRNMIAYLTKSDASEGKKVIITKDTVREALRLDDAESIDYLPNEEIFTELARMGYEKPLTNLTFYKAFFSVQWKFLIHTILQCMSAKRTALNEFISSMASAVICLATVIIHAQVGDLSSHTTNNAYPALTQKVFANMRRVGKGFFGVETPLFEGMLLPQQAAADVDDVVVDDVPTVTSTLPPSLVSPPSSPLQQPQPSQPTTISMDLLNSLLETCTTLTRRVKNLEQDKIAQALEITKLKQRVRRLEKMNRVKASGLKRLKKEVDAAKDTKVEKNVDIQGRQEESQAKFYHIDLEHAYKVLSMQDDEPEPAELKEVIKLVTTAKLMTKVVTVAAPITAAIITAAPSAARRRKGVVIIDPEETATPSTIVHSEPKSKDKGKVIMVQEPKPLKKQAQIEQDEAYARELEVELNKNINWDDVIEKVKEKGKQDNIVLRYQALKKKPQTEAQARKNMMVYLKNMAGFKMDYFKGMSYDDIRPIFKKYFNSNVAFLVKSKEQLEEEESRALKRTSESLEEKVAKKQKLDEEVEELKKHLQIVPNDDDDFYTEATPLALKVPVVDYKIYTENNKPYYKIIRADGSHQLFLSFLSLLRNFDREDLEILWQIVKERFASLKPKSFPDDFLLTTLKAMFEKLNVEDQIWKNQKGIHGLANVKSYRLLESCGVHIITFITTQMILLVERRYPLTRFTLEQMLNNVRLQRYTLRDYYYWLNTYCCWYMLMLLDNVADIKLRLLEQSDVVVQIVSDVQIVKTVSITVNIITYKLRLLVNAA